MTEKSFQLRAIVAVEPAYRVLCQQPGCGHGVYARIHVVEEDGKLLVLGSDCFAKRYGAGRSAHFKGFGGSGGRLLTDAERELLQGNTAALLAQFEDERARSEAQASKKLTALRQMYVSNRRSFPKLDAASPLRKWESEPVVSALPSIPSPAWAALKKPNSSFFAYGVGDGQCWVVMQSASHEGCFIAPAPIPFDGWDEALPPSIGEIDVSRNVYISCLHINSLMDWFAGRSPKGSRINSDALAIQRFAQSCG